VQTYESHQAVASEATTVHEWTCISVTVQRVCSVIDLNARRSTQTKRVKLLEMQWTREGSVER